MPGSDRVCPLTRQVGDNPNQTYIPREKVPWEKMLLRRYLLDSVLLMYSDNSLVICIILRSFFNIGQSCSVLNLDRPQPLITSCSI